MIVSENYIDYIVVINKKQTFNTQTAWKTKEKKNILTCVTFGKKILKLKGNHLYEIGENG